LLNIQHRHASVAGLHNEMLNIGQAAALSKHSSQLQNILTITCVFWLALYLHGDFFIQ
jgi:hypothetical protein